MIIRGGASVSFYAEPEEFIAIAEDAGLELVRYWPHDLPVGRYNYLFRKSYRSDPAVSYRECFTGSTEISEEALGTPEAYLSQ